MVGQLNITTPRERTSLKWDSEDAASVAEVRAKFDQLVTAERNLAYAQQADGTHEKIKEFDPTAAAIMISSQIQGG